MNRKNMCCRGIADGSYAADAVCSSSLHPIIYKTNLNEY